MTKKWKCPFSHKEVQTFECDAGVIYRLGLGCGAVYIGETVRCPNTRLKEHLADVEKSSTLKEHLNLCGCDIKFEYCHTINSRLPLLYPRRLLETITMERGRDFGENIISKPLVIPTNMERIYIDRFLPLATFYDQ